jgi:hypothetical protein
MKHHQLNRGLLLCWGAILIFATGCAFGTRHAQITYPPVGETENLAAAPPAGSSRGRIALQPFQDGRGDKSLVGNVRNGLGMKTADVVCDNADLAELVTYAVRTELRKAGYEVVDVKSSNSNGTLVLSGSLTEMYCDAYFAYDGRVTLSVRIERDGRQVLQGDFAGKGSVGMNWAATGSSYGDSLSLALKQAIDAMIQQLPDALKD